VKYRVRHSTTYVYRSPVDLATHMVHLSPRAMAHQRILATTLAAEPAPVRSTEAVDHFGNRVTWMFLDLPHERFEVTMEAVVDVGFPPPPVAAETPPWEEVAAAARAGGAAWQAAEYTFDSPMVAHEPAAGTYAAPSFPPGRPVLEGVRDLTSRIRREFAFRAGVTTISTPVSKVLQLRAGVCQDFTHLMIAGLRCLGLPARYVSGYIRTKPPPGTVRRRGAAPTQGRGGAGRGGRPRWGAAAPTSRMPGSAPGWGRATAGWISIRPTT
jgi:transglutaminase-like putative cysteine protease